MVEIFLKHVLGIGSEHKGLYGDTAAYYGTVEEPGRLNLHLHMLIWIANALTPQEIRDKIMDKKADFQKAMVEYLEGVHCGEFIGTDMAGMQSKLEEKYYKNPKESDPTCTLPVSPPDSCTTHQEELEDDCEQCTALRDWRNQFRDTTNELLYRSNKHNCHAGCTSVKYPTCKSRFPRELHEETLVDLDSGSLRLKKGEKWLNTFSPVLTYVSRCNTDITSLLSGTAIKSIIAYVTDYITKTPL
ncbi:hypothetical protein OF83DRAFT_1166726 [Amylostereum chailletii]|nr:hypothetical protein OF83DRAFT_1166726 [Amylostereum chailletii]